MAQRASFRVTLFLVLLALLPLPGRAAGDRGARGHETAGVVHRNTLERVLPELRERDLDRVTVPRRERGPQREGGEGIRPGQKSDNPYKLLTGA